MRKQIQHIYIFSLWFTKQSQLSNILSRIPIGIGHIATAWATKVLAIPITNRFTDIASLACVMRVNHYKRNTCKFSFVFKERPKLTKRPRMVPPSLYLSDFCSFPNMSQIFNSNPLAFRFSLFNNLLTNGMVGNGGKSLFSALKPFQKFSTSFRAFGLNGASHFKSLISNFIQIVRTKICSIGESCNAGYSKIHTYKFLNILNIIFRDFYGLEKIKLSFLCNKVCLPFDIRKIFRVMTDEGNFQPAIYRPDGDKGFFIGKDTRVVGDCSEWLKCSLSFLIKFIGIYNLTDTTNKYLCGKPSSFFQRMVNKVVGFKLIKNLLFPYCIRNLITGNIGFSKSCQKRLSLFIIRQKFYLQSKFHGVTIHHIFENVKQNLLRKEAGNSSPIKQSLNWGLLAW